MNELSDCGDALFAGIIDRLDGQKYFHIISLSILTSSITKKGCVMKIPEKMAEVLRHEGVVAIGTMSDGRMHMVNTWNSYIKATEDGRLLFPAGGMKTTEANITKDNNVLITIGSRDVEGLHGFGTGFRISGVAAFIKEGSEFDEIKRQYPWARAAVEIRVVSVTQTL